MPGLTQGHPTNNTRHSGAFLLELISFGVGEHGARSSPNKLQRILFKLMCFGLVLQQDYY